MPRLKIKYDKSENAEFFRVEVTESYEFVHGRDARIFAETMLEDGHTVSMYMVDDAHWVNVQRDLTSYASMDE